MVELEGNEPAPRGAPTLPVPAVTASFAKRKCGKPAETLNPALNTDPQTPPKPQPHHKLGKELPGSAQRTEIDHLNGDFGAILHGTEKSTEGTVN